MTTGQLTRTIPTGVLTPEFLAALREGYEMDAGDRARQNAVAGAPVNTLALNRKVVYGEDGHFSHRIKSKGITNQKKSGRCWLYAGLNVMRPQVIRDHHMEDFEFSVSYLQFWDKLEKSNLYLESVIELRDVGFLDREWELVNRHMNEDGGWWNYVAGLVEKYGVVPASVMPETYGSTHTQTFNHVLGRLLRARAAAMLDMHADGAGVEQLRAAKDEALKEVYRFLVINLGEPPVDFIWRYRRKKPAGTAGGNGSSPASVAETELTDPERYTPMSFYRKFVGLPLGGYVCLYNDPQNELERHYRFARTSNIVGNECMHFVNIDTAAMKQIALNSIVANEPVWLAVDMYTDQCGKRGLMEHQLFDYEALFGIDLTISKADRVRLYAGTSCHAMALMGVDLDPDQRPRKWLVENSWGDKKGDKGWWTIRDAWFDEHVYTIIVHRRHVPATILKRFDEEPQELAPWYPCAQRPD